jgi:ribonuclease P protein subunit RPR2
MAKGKVDGPKKVPHPHLHARLSFLQQAAQLLEGKQLPSQNATPQGHETVIEHSKTVGKPLSRKFDLHRSASQKFLFKSNPIARELSAHTTAITRKSKLCVAPKVKRTICKRCSSKLMEGLTSSSRIENKSRNGQKAWADVLVVTCLSCQMEKRFPVGQTRGRKKNERNAEVALDSIAKTKANG